MAALLLTIIMALTVMVGIVFGKRMSQRDIDRRRRIYELSFPAELSMDQVLGWLRAISGTSRRKHSGFQGVSTIVLESRSTANGMQHYMRVGWQDADLIIQQLRTAIAGIQVTDVSHVYDSYTYGVEWGLTHTSRQLRIVDAYQTSAAVISSMGALVDNEVVAYQWVITPAPPQHPPIGDYPLTTRS